jgi:hypothetical protein
MKRRLIVPAFFYFDLDEEDYPEFSDRELFDAMRRAVDNESGRAQDVANEWLSKSNNPNSGLLLDDSPTFEVDADGEVPYALYDMWRKKIVEL